MRIGFEVSWFFHLLKLKSRFQQYITSPNLKLKRPKNTVVDRQMLIWFLVISNCYCKQPSDMCNIKSFTLGYSKKTINSKIEQHLVQVIAHMHLCTYRMNYERFFFGRHRCFTLKWLDAQGSFTNYVDKILAFLDHLPPCVDVFYLILVDKKWTFLDHLPTSSCKRSL